MEEGRSLEAQDMKISRKLFSLKQAGRFPQHPDSPDPPGQGGQVRGGINEIL